MSITQNDIIIHSWAELCQRLYDNSWQSDLGRFRSNYAFRGISDKDYDLKTSFMRICITHPHLEYHLLRNFSKYAQIPGADVHYSNWRWMTIAQHHGLPTRLLDWTYSPFVAMHFATANTDCFDRDSAIWFVDYVKINSMLPKPLITVLKSKGANAFTLKMLERALPDIKSFDNLTSENLVLFFEPPSDDARIVNQFAFFSVMSNPAARLDHWLEKHPDVYGRVIIPRELKWEVRDKLDQANITERLLFPGLDGLAAWLTRQYTPKDCQTQKS
ncbi:MAG: FRG domain-containing protein [Desulfobacteraceae bacterium]|jgi:hypothetical protein